MTHSNNKSNKQKAKTRKEKFSFSPRASASNLSAIFSAQRLSDGATIVARFFNGSNLDRNSFFTKFKLNHNVESES